VFGKAALVFLMLAGCADPKYVSRDGGPNSSQKAVSERAELPNSKSSVWLDWEKIPTSEDFGSFTLKFGRENAADKSPVVQDVEGEIAVVIWMPSMGHASSPVTVAKVDTGTYRATQVFFTMPGDWEIRIQRLGTGTLIEQAVFPNRF
jgi:hypothetical protein